MAVNGGRAGTKKGPNWGHEILRPIMFRTTAIGNVRRQPKFMTCLLLFLSIPKVSGEGICVFQTCLPLKPPFPPGTKYAFKTIFEGRGAVPGAVRQHISGSTSQLQRETLNGAIWPLENRKKNDQQKHPDRFRTFSPVFARFRPFSHFFARFRTFWDVCFWPFLAVRFRTFSHHSPAAI